MLGENTFFLRSENFLIKEDVIKQADAIFVLGGGSYDRGKEAVKIFEQGYAKKIVCTSENVPSIFKSN